MIFSMLLTTNTSQVGHKVGVSSSSRAKWGMTKRVPQSEFGRRLLSFPPTYNLVLLFRKSETHPTRSPR